MNDTLVLITNTQNKISFDVCFTFTQGNNIFMLFRVIVSMNSMNL